MLGRRRDENAGYRAASAVWVVLMCACGPGSGVLDPERPVFKGEAGGQSGGEGDRGDCRESAASEVDLEATLPGWDSTPAAALARVAGTHRSSVSFHSVEPPGGQASEGEALEITLEGAGTARHHAACGLLEIDVRVALRSQSGGLHLRVPGIVLVFASGPPRVTAEFPLTDLPDWNAALQGALEPDRDSHFRLDMTLVDDDFAQDGVADSAFVGHFAVVSDKPRQFGHCELAHWPAMGVCDADERSVPADEPYRGLRADYLVDALRTLEAPELEWLDGPMTRLSVDFERDGDVVCVREQSPQCDDNCDGRVRYSVPGRLRLATEDGQLDVTVSARLDTEGIEGAFRDLGLTTNGQVVAEPDAIKQADFEGLDPSQRLVVRFGTLSSLYSASLELWALTANPHIVEPGRLCTTNDYIGPLSELGNGSTRAP